MDECSLQGLLFHEKLRISKLMDGTGANITHKEAKQRSQCQTHWCVCAGADIFRGLKTVAAVGSPHPSQRRLLCLSRGGLWVCEQTAKLRALVAAGQPTDQRWSGLVWHRLTDLGSSLCRLASVYPNPGPSCHTSVLSIPLSAFWIF